MKWTDDNSENSNTYEKTNHYLAPEFYVYIGRDKFYKGHNGPLAFVQFNLGKGAYKSGSDFTHPNDVFGYGKGIE